MTTVMQALGGRANIAAVQANASRLCISVHLVVGPEARAWAAEMGNWSDAKAG